MKPKKPKRLKTRAAKSPPLKAKRLKPKSPNQKRSKSKHPKTNSYWEVNLTDLPRPLEPALTVWLFRNGCLGTAEKLDFQQPSLKFEAVIKKRQIISLSAYFDLARREEIDSKLKTWLAGCAPETRVQWTLQEPQDWMTQWRKYFKTFKLAGFVIVPSWKIKTNTDWKKTIAIEPGMAFGTGTHATTQFALEQLRSLDSTLSKTSVIDVGSGSGILAVAAERLGAQKIRAIDNDPECWRESEKTFKLNRTKRCQVSHEQLEEVQDSYDIVIANIIDGILMELKEDLWRITKAGGYLILSGILTDGADAFIRDFMENHSGIILKRLSDLEWTSFLVQKV